jgi:sugar phosphate permease
MNAARAVVLSWLAYATYYLGRKGFSVVKSTLARELGLSTRTLALIDTAYLVAYALGQVPSGLAVDRLGPRRVIVLGLTLSACACLAFSAASAPAVFALFFALNGLAQSTGWPASTKVMAQWVSGKTRGRTMGIWSTCYQIGGVAATALATYRYGAAYFCLKLMRYSLLFWLPYYLHHGAGLDEITSGYVSTAFEVGGAVGSITVGAISDRFEDRGRVASWSLLLLAAALVAYGAAGGGGWAWHAMALAVLGALVFGPDALISGAAAQEAAAPAAAATAVGLVNGIGSVGALFQGVLTVGVQEAWGWKGLFHVFVGLAVVAAGCLLRFRSKRAQGFGT